MSIEIQCMTEKLIIITIKLDYSKVPSKSTLPTCAHTWDISGARFFRCSDRQTDGSNLFVDNYYEL